ncbi:BTB/POZ domain-containing protein 17 [Aplysia californica]|uniref:BTB/POZ domain-containing protein 17 n=1 Tax=Aplysia californica TaxID=6500 RepID=A0ABM1W1P1_APLCA|nr:BTB/POZ domain-containing protein 17 [Aplysia californica]XP_005109674.1 BTB/POZ domain-containing protein 17 [Aplysia californica]XP_035828584.1 BTB/POZ domain-containing protein 17 [Aplysia californica]XP_035828585.1 BTB/POZ domain-containing protein 17 [Aplysia californica]
MGNVSPFSSSPAEMEDPPKKKMHKGESSSAGDQCIEVIDDSKAFVARFAVLFNSADFSDVKLRVGDVSFFGHKFILASASKVFKAMFGNSSAWEESRQQEIRLVEEEACQAVFYDFLRYFYSASIDMSTDKALPLLLLADKYNVQSLRNACVDYMMKHIEELPDKNKTLTWYHYSKLTGPERLRDACKDFIVSNFSVVLDAHDWVEMEREELADFVGMSELCVESEQKLWEKVEQWLMADNNAEYRRENVETIIPLLRFCKMTPSELLALESSPLMQEFADALKDKLGAAYRFHSLASNGVFLHGEQVPYRNYTSKMYGLRFQFELRNYANIPKIESRVCLSCQVPYMPFCEGKTDKNNGLAQFQANFYPKGYFSTISLYGNFMARQNDNVTLKISRQNAPYTFGGLSDASRQYPPMLVEATLQLYGKKKELRFVGLTLTKTHVFTSKTPDLVVENVLDLSRLKAEESPFVVEGSLSGAVFVKVQQVGDHLLEEAGAREASAGACFDRGPSNASP